MLGIVLTGLRSFEEIELRSWDWRLRAAADPQRADRNIKLIVVDQPALDIWANAQGITWPWPRSLYAPVINYLQAAGARGVAFDILFTESSTWGVSEDEQLAASFTEELPVISAVVLSRVGESREAEEDLSYFRERQRALSGASTLTQLRRTAAERSFVNVTLPVRQILEKSAAFGNVGADPDGDGVFRHYPLVTSYQLTPVLGLPVALYAAIHPDGLANIDQILSTSDESRLLPVRFHGGAGTYDTYSIATVLNSAIQRQEGKIPDLPLETFRGSYVLLGLTAPGLLDLRSMPLAERYPGVEFNATVLDNLIHRDFIHRLSLTENGILAASCGALVGFIFLLLHRGRYQALAQVLLFTATVAAAWFLAREGVWIDIVRPVFVMTVGILGGLALQYTFEGQQARFLKHAFRHYVSGAVIDQIIAQPERLQLGGERRQLTIFFSDIAKFTTLSEALPPQRLVALLNRYLTEMTGIILQSGGTLDKYQGDAIIAFWNAPIAVEGHALQAVQAACECTIVLARIREQLATEFGIDLHHRIGLNTGEAVVGNFGSRSRFNYTMIGDAVNLASRIEGVNKVFGTSVIFTESTFSQLGGEIRSRRIGIVRVVGRAEPVAIYEPLLDGISTIQPAHEAVFASALQAFEAGDLAGASKQFELCVGDSVSKKYLLRISEIRESGTTADTSVWSLTEK